MSFHKKKEINLKNKIENLKNKIVNKIYDDIFKLVQKSDRKKMFRIEKKSGNTPDHEPENHEKENIYKVVKLKKI